MSSKGRLTVPKVVREALGLGEGDDVVFRIEGDRAVLARTPGPAFSGKPPRGGHDPTGTVVAVVGVTGLEPVTSAV